MVCYRNAFVASSGYVLLSLDYSQIEARIMAHFSADRRLRTIFHSQGTVLFHNLADCLPQPEGVLNS